MVWPSVWNPSDWSYDVIQKFRIRLSTNQYSARITDDLRHLLSI